MARRTEIVKDLRNCATHLCDHCSRTEESCQQLLVDAADMLQQDCGTQMSQADYLELDKHSATEHMSKYEAICYINQWFGFEASKIKIFVAVQTFKTIPASEHGCSYNRVVPDETYTRKPLHASSDWNYIRFDVLGCQYECVNGELFFYYD